MAYKTQVVIQMYISC